MLQDRGKLNQELPFRADEMAYNVEEENRLPSVVL